MNIPTRRGNGTSSFVPEPGSPNSRFPRKALALLQAQAQGKQLKNQQRRIVARFQRQQLAANASQEAAA